MGGISQRALVAGDDLSSDDGCVAACENLAGMIAGQYL